MKPQSSMLTMLTSMFGVSRLSTKYFHGLQEAAKHEPWQARVLGTGNHHVEPISTMLRPVAGAKKNWMRVWIQDLQQKKIGNGTAGSSKSWRPGAVVSLKQGLIQCSLGWQTMQGACSCQSSPEVLAELCWQYNWAETPEAQSYRRRDCRDL